MSQQDAFTQIDDLIEKQKYQEALKLLRCKQGQLPETPKLFRYLFVMRRLGKHSKVQEFSNNRHVSRVPQLANLVALSLMDQGFFIEASSLIRQIPQFPSIDYLAINYVIATILSLDKGGYNNLHFIYDKNLLNSPKIWGEVLKRASSLQIIKPLEESIEWLRESANISAYRAKLLCIDISSIRKDTRIDITITKNDLSEATNSVEDVLTLIRLCSITLDTILFDEISKALKPHHKRDPLIQIEFGSFFYQIGQVPQALQVFESIESQDSEVRLRVLCNRFSCLLRLEKILNAKDLALQIKTLDTFEHSKCLVLLAYHEHKYEMVVNLSAALEADRLIVDSSLVLVLAYSLMKQKELEKAFEFIELVKKKDGLLDEMFCLSQFLCKQLGKFDLVEQSYSDFEIDYLRPPNPFHLLCLTDDIHLCSKATELWANRWFKTDPNRRIRQPVNFDGTGPIVIGYFSADFYNFPGMTLMKWMFEHHDRDRFKVICFHYGPDIKDETREYVEKHADEFFEVSKCSFEEVEKLSRQKNIHIAIHRNGYTEYSKNEWFAKRLAPVQIAFLGYPGTSFLNNVDYLIADPIVIPSRDRNCYSEKIIFLNTYQPNDQWRERPEKASAKPDELNRFDVVFASFNNSFKIGRAELEVWASILASTPNSCLWLLESRVKQWNREVVSWFEARGLSARLVFAARTDHYSHMARHHHVSIFLDSFSYGAHTTATDALLMGVPVITVEGNKFSSRVGASLLNAVGFSEFVAKTKEEYQELAIRLALDKERLRELRKELFRNIKRTSLFNSCDYIYQFETALEICLNQISANAVADFSVLGENSLRK
ncbi:hypothetical protein N9W46_08475 [Litoricolaceae bacterium]|nr:hypothetical protein [Litorivicinaceae bacterium]